MTRLRDRMQEQGVPHSVGSGSPVIFLGLDGSIVDSFGDESKNRKREDSGDDKFDYNHFFEVNYGIRFDEDEGRWITTDNGHKVHLNEEGEPDKGNPNVIEQMTEWKPRPMPEKPTKSKANAKLKDLANSEDYDAIDTYLYELPVGSTMKLPASYGDGDKPVPLVKKEDGWYCNAWKTTVSTSELSSWFCDVDEERPVITKIADGEMVKKPLKVELPDSVMEKYVWNEEASDARHRAMYADDEREQFRFFADYMNGVGYGKSHEAFYNYNYHGDTLINGMLRGNMPRELRQQKEWAENEEKTRQFIDEMTDAISKNRLQSGATVFRGIQTADGVAKTLGMNMTADELSEALKDPDFAESLKGRTFSDPGFASTSIDRQVPRKGGFDKACRMEIYCPQGTQGAYCGDYLRITDEAEYILQRGTQFVVLNAYTEMGSFYSDDRRLVLEVAVVGQEPQPIPELKRIYDPKPKIYDAIQKETTLPKKEIRELYPNISDGALDDMVRLHDNKDFDQTHDILSEELFAGNITPEDAGELYSYAFHASSDVYGKIDDFKRYKKNEDIPAKEETANAVRAEYPDMTDKMVNHIAFIRDTASELRERAKEYEQHEEVAKQSNRLIKEADRIAGCEKYAVRAFNHAKERGKS